MSCKYGLVIIHFYIHKKKYPPNEGKKVTLSDGRASIHLKPRDSSYFFLCHINFEMSIKSNQH